MSGCSLTPTAAPTPENTLAIHGVAQGGQQPLIGAHVYLYAAGTSGYGTQATSLLNSTANTMADGSGHYYVTTVAGGAFTIGGDYTCTPGSMVYLYLVGGNPGAGDNSAAGLLAILGACPTATNFASTTPYVFMDEVSTIAAAYAMAGFATDATHVSSSGTDLAKTGIQNAFANAANLAGLSSGLALNTTPNGNGTVPQQEINSLANILGTCINSEGPSSYGCSTLFSNALSAGITGSTPADTATAAINIAHNPGVNIDALFGLLPAESLFSPALYSQPNDFTVAITFSNIGLSSPQVISVDGSGNIWVPNSTTNNVTELTGTGDIIPISPLPAAGLNYPYAMVIDDSGNAWFANIGSSTITELDITGANVSSSPFSDTGMIYPQAIAIDGVGGVWALAGFNGSVSKFDSTGTVVFGSPFITGTMSGSNAIATDSSGNAWVTNPSNSITELNSSGAAVSGSPFTVGGLDYPIAIAIDGSGNAWIANQGSTGSGNVVKLDSTGAAAVGSPFTDGGVNSPYGIAIDGAGNAWVTNVNRDSVSEFSNNGTAISGPHGYSIDNGSGYNIGLWGIAIDGSGGVWVTDSNTNNLTEFVGASVPVVTPLTTGVKNSTLGTRP